MNGKAGDELGSLSKQYESNGNPGAIGYDSTGGYSYGTYQIATNTGTMDAFLNYLKKNQPDMMNALSPYRPGSQAFNQRWKQLAQDPQFEDAQHDFIGATHYSPAVNKIAQKTGFNAQQYPSVVQDVIWSTAVQHGPTGAANVFANAGIRNGMNPREVVQRVYNERSNVNKYFSSSTPQVKQAVQNRFQNELQNALTQLG